MIKPLLLCCALLFADLQVFATLPDSSVIIASAKNTYQFVYNSKAARVEIKHILNTVYASNNYTVTLPVAETYNDQVTIDKVECRVDNHTPSNFQPKYSYYSVNDVFYSDEKICYFQLFLQKKGSIANVTFTETIADPRYLTSAYFSDNYAVKKRDMVFKIPRWMNVELKEMNFGSYNITKTTTYDKGDDTDIITYTAVNLPASQTEENSPGPTYIYPHILILSKSAKAGGRDFRYLGTVEDLYSWCHGLTKAVVNDRALLSAKAKELTAGLTNDMDKIKALFYYVQDNVRYIAFEDGMAGFKPEKADEVLRKKYGDCKGMANLTKELLTAAGYDARLCWLGTDHIAYDYQTPSLAVDNHMICALNYKGKIIYLDATETYLGLNEYAERIQGRQVMMEDGDHFVLNKVPYAVPSQNYDFESSKLVIDGTSLSGSVKHLWKGEDKESVLSGLNSVKKEKADEAMNHYLSNNNNDYGIKELNLSSTDNIDKDLTAAYKFDYKNAVSSFSKAYYVDLDFKKEFLNSAIKTDERKHDYWFDYKTNLYKEAELTIPAKYKVTNVPAPLNIVNPDYEFHIAYDSQPGKLIYKKNIIIKNTHLSVSKFAQWNKDVEQLAKTYNENITLKPLSE
ncbi:transglutaminase family protein [Mucilaginibacter sp.]|uniref:transglutaminase-like domain-containing protein n=1 Tax=Mucilaginibacter sp. TaxID=1882438 RepID=UPI00260C353C|nr:transglutaminase domain-containing protein [Mucilaginibacter sp.]MDB4920419.1 Transglutaminase-like superfamily protein [Mucilaginibacter sp.]